MQMMARLGNGAEGLIQRLPSFVRNRLDGATRAALTRAFSAASGSRRVLRDRGDLFNRMLSTASGAAGGAAGFAGALV